MVGSISTIVITVVTTASRTERPSDEVKPDWLITEPKDLMPANRNAMSSGIEEIHRGDQEDHPPPDRGPGGFPVVRSAGAP